MRGDIGLFTFRCSSGPELHSSQTDPILSRLLSSGVGCRRERVLFDSKREDTVFNAQNCSNFRVKNGVKERSVFVLMPE